MIQFSKPKRSLNKAMDPFRRHEVSAKEALGNGSGFEGEARVIYITQILIFIKGVTQVPVASILHSTGPMTHFPIFLLILSLSSLKPPILLDCRPLQELLVLSIQIPVESAAPNAVLTAVMRLP